MSHVGFIGLGKMGAPMAANIVKAGRTVRGFDLIPVLCEEASRNGVDIAASELEVADGAAAIVTMLPSGPHVLAALDDMLPAISGDTLVIDCSTIDIVSAQRMHERVRSVGALCLDAPVSGGVAGATAGALTFLCGGGEAAFDAARPLLEMMGANIILCGGAGMGQAAKLCNNMILGATMIATAEAFVLGEKLGLSHQALFNAVAISSGQSWSLIKYCPVPGPVPASPANNNYEPGFMSALMLKDLTLAQDAAAAAALATPLGAMAQQMFARFNVLGHGREDFSGIINMIRDRGNISSS